MLQQSEGSHSVFTMCKHRYGYEVETAYTNDRISRNVHARTAIDIQVIEINPNWFQ